MACGKKLKNIYPWKPPVLIVQVLDVILSFFWSSPGCVYTELIPSIYPSIHPSIFFRSSGAGLWWQQAQQSSPDVPLPSNTFQLLWGDPEAFPGQMRYVIPPACSGSTPGSLASWMYLENLHRKPPRRHLDQMPEPPRRHLDQMPEPIGSFWRKGAVALLRAPSGCLSSSSYL